MIKILPPGLYIAWIHILFMIAYSSSSVATSGEWRRVEYVSIYTIHIRQTNNFKFSTVSLPLKITLVYKEPKFPKLFSEVCFLLSLFAERLPTCEQLKIPFCVVVGCSNSSKKSKKIKIKYMKMTLKKVSSRYPRIQN